MTLEAKSDNHVGRLCLEFLQRADGSMYFTTNRDYLIVHPQLLAEDVDRFLLTNSGDPHSSPVAYAFARMRILFQRDVTGLELH
jgi:hypothetical protein